MVDRQVVLDSVNMGGIRLQGAPASGSGVQMMYSQNSSEAATHSRCSTMIHFSVVAGEAAASGLEPALEVTLLAILSVHLASVHLVLEVLVGQVLQASAAHLQVQVVVVVECRRV